MADCLFCKIVAGDVPSAKVYEDDLLYAFLDIKPLANGHTLVVPKQHAAKLEDADVDTQSALMPAVAHIARAICETVPCPDTTIAMNNGPEAGQEIAHMHLHIIPRRQGDPGGPIHSLFHARSGLRKDALEEIAAQIRDKLRENVP